MITPTPPTHPAGMRPVCHCSALRKATRQATQLYDRALAPVGLRITQFALLSTLERSGPVAITALAARMHMDRTTMGRALRPLEREGLVAIGAGRDRRTRGLVLTAQGEARLAEALPLWHAAQAQFETRYGAEETRRLDADLARVADRL